MGTAVAFLSSAEEEPPHVRVLIVEDDRELAGVLCRALREQNYAVECAHDGETALHLARTEPFDLILLDLMIPGIDGIAVCRKVRAANATLPIIMLTARDHTDDRILGLDAGADDYIVKPFSMGELYARIRAVLRRASREIVEVLQVGNLQLDPRKSSVELGSRRIGLTPKEFALLEYFMHHPDRIVTRTEILENVWDSNYEGLSNIVDVYVNYLRNKIEETGEPRRIVTIRNRGYMLRESTDAP
jgi:DNA-binding response OmpR family regulator